MKNYRPHFTGHETFPLKYGWLKAFDQINLLTTDQKLNQFF